jgi:hypothetical protein
VTARQRWERRILPMRWRAYWERGARILPVPDPLPESAIVMKYQSIVEINRQALAERRR